MNFSEGHYKGLHHFLGATNLSPSFQSEDIKFIWSYFNVFIIKDAIL